MPQIKADEKQKRLRADAEEQSQKRAPTDEIDEVFAGTEVSQLVVHCCLAYVTGLATSSYVAC